MHGEISRDASGDVDVYSFKADVGTEIWIDIDQTTYALDTMIERLVWCWLVQPTMSRGMWPEPLIEYPMDKFDWLGGDFYTSNYGMRECG